MKVFFVIIIVWCLSPCFLQATSISTPAASASRGLTGALDDYQKANEGRLPRSWEELDGKFISLEKVEQELGGPIEQRFTLTTNVAVEMARPGKYEVFNGGTILAVSSPVSEDRREEGAGRYVIWKAAEGKIRFSWLYENVIQGQFAKANIKLTDGPLQVQPSTLNASPNAMLEKYAEENFKDPKKPTAEELVRAKEYFTERYGDTDKRPEKKPGPNQAGPESLSWPTTLSNPSSAAMTQAPITETKTSWWLIISVFIGIIAAAFMVFLVVGDKPPKR